MNRSEKLQRLETQLLELFARAKLPTSPAIASRILELIDRPDSTAQQFAGLIEADPALAARLLKMANSAKYAQRNPVTTIQRAITVLGNRQLRVMVLGFELVGHLDRLGDSRFDLPRFWQHSVLRACVARSIATRVVPTLAEEAFLVGLLADCGILPLVQVLGAPYAELFESDRSPAAFFADEQQRFPFTHCDAIAVLGRMWGLPEQITRPLATHHEAVDLEPESSDAARLDAVCYFVGCLAFTDEAMKVPADRELLAYAGHQLGLGDTELAAAFAAAAQAFARVAPLFQDRMTTDQDVADLLAVANRHLLETACASEDRAREVEAERDRILDEHLTLRTALGQYREQAARDPLTGLLNRRALLDSLDLLHQERPCTVTLMFVDIDNFKSFNDDFGHHVGDAVLKMIADTMRVCAGDRGLAGRYGGEEFIAVLTNLTEPQAREAAERMVREVRSAVVPGVDVGGPVTASVGAVWCTMENAPTLSGLIGIADELMYSAKRSGKDRACYRSLDDPDSVVALASSDGEDLSRTLGIPLEVFQDVADRLEQQTRKVCDEDSRKQPRQTAQRPCTINYFFPPTRRMLRSDGYVRTMSTGGIGLLTGRALTRGDLVEIELEWDGRTLFAAGLVAFSRHVEGPIHEVGVQLFQTAQEPVLSGDPEGALRDLDWAAQAIQAAATSPRRVA